MPRLTLYKHKAIDTTTWNYKLPEASWEWARHECQIEPDLYQYLESVGATYSPIASTLSCFGDPKEQVGSLWHTLNQLVLSERENQFIKGVLEIQVGLQQSTITSLTENVKRQASFVDKMQTISGFAVLLVAGQCVELLIDITSFLNSLHYTLVRRWCKP